MKASFYEKGIDIIQKQIEDLESEINHLTITKGNNTTNTTKKIMTFLKNVKKFIRTFKIYILIFCFILILLIKNIVFQKALPFINNFISFQNKYYKIINIYYLYSFTFDMVKVEYNVGIFDEKKNLISPSDLPLYDDIHIFCNFIIINKNISIDSIANIYKNKYFNCIEFFKFKETVKFGIKVLNGKTKKYSNICNFTEKIFDYNKNKYKNDKIFSQIYIQQKYKILLDLLKKEELCETLRLKSFYIKYPLCKLKRDIIIKEEKWNFQNLYNHYFCFCKGQKCSEEKVSQSCKYDFYKYIIDNNRNEYNKTDYLFIDFIFKEFGEDDTYPVFKEMNKNNYPVHYLTEKKDIYHKYCLTKKKCTKIILINRIAHKLYADFLEKYLTLFLKLKSVISAKENPYYTLCKLYYKIEYITYIAVGHGLCFFKDFLYAKNQIYGYQMNNKLLIPPSKILISLAKSYGWKDEDLIKINLPRWDKFNVKMNSNQILNNNGKIKQNSILIMFTWRELKSNKSSISPYYFNNITNLITNKLLLKELKKKNITLYFTMHRFLYFKKLKKYKNFTDKNIVFINQNEISESLGKVDLILTDFSSILFDVMYRNKPFIIYFPDIDDPNINIIYSKAYSYIFNKMKKNKFGFKNVFFNISEAIQKIIYYIKNNFTIEEELKKFYKIFIPERGNSIPKFIDFLKQLK